MFIIVLYNGYVMLYYIIYIINKIDKYYMWIALYYVYYNIIMVMLCYVIFINYIIIITKLYK